METLYRKVAVSEPSQFEHNKYYHFVDFDGNIQGDCFFNYSSFDEYTHRYKYFLVEFPDPTAQLKADKEELLSALEDCKERIEKMNKKLLRLTNYYHVSVYYVSGLISLIQKHKQ